MPTRHQTARKAVLQCHFGPTTHSQNVSIQVQAPYERRFAGRVEARSSKVRKNHQSGSSPIGTCHSRWLGESPTQKLDLRPRRCLCATAIVVGKEAEGGRRCSFRSIRTVVFVVESRSSTRKGRLFRRVAPRLIPAPYQSTRARLNPCCSLSMPPKLSARSNVSYATATATTTASFAKARRRRA